MPSRRSTVTPTEAAGLLGVGVGHTYVKNQDWISPDQLPVRASQEKDILAQSDEGIANLLGDPTVAQAFMDAFTEYCSGQQDQATQAQI